MTLSETINEISRIALLHTDIKSFRKGNKWDSGSGKSSDVYPAVWLELPVLSSYNPRNKSFTFGMNVLMLAKRDDIDDVINKQSQSERILDELIYAIQFKLKRVGVENIDGITLQNFNDDLACGYRVDLTIITERECDPLSKFTSKI